MENTSTTREEMLAQLEWYRAAGVDLCVGEAPVNQFAATAATKSLSSSTSPPASSIVNAGNPKPAAAGANTAPGGAPQSNAHSTAQPNNQILTTELNPQEARELAASANNLVELRTKMEAYEGCPLKLRATQLVFADGNPEADIMLVGEAPGRDEDLQGKPFVGRSGQLLDKILAAIGLDRTKVYIANTVPWRPPGNRTPTPAEISVCLPFIHRQIELVAPKIMITLGAAATQTMFEEKLSIIKVRGQWREITVNGIKIQTMPTLHPAFLLRQPLQKRDVWSDFLKVRTALSELGEI